MTLRGSRSQDDAKMKRLEEEERHKNDFYNHITPVCVCMCASTGCSFFFHGLE